MKTIVTSGNQNGKPYRISYISAEYSSHYELEIYDRETDQFVQKGGSFNSLANVQNYLEQTYGPNV